MKHWTTLGLIVTVLSGLWIGCGSSSDSKGDASKCDQAEKILKDCDMGGDEPSDCNAEAQREADCVIKNPKGACATDDSKEANDYLACALNTK
jgi:hypothetical protein